MSLEEMKAYQEGKEAREKGEQKVNPYRRYTKEEAWNAGWNSVEKEEDAIKVTEPVTVLLFGVLVAQIAGLAYILFVM